MRSKVTLFSFMALLFSVFLGSSSLVYAEEMHHKHGGSEMGMHHMHMLMDHGITMVVQGSNMVMLAQMKMAPGVDTKTLQHGQHMMKEGKELITRVLNGPEMTAMMKEHATDPLMEYTHQLGEAMLKLTDILEKMSMEDMSSADMMGMHHMHMMINHAVEMAAQGADLIMLGKMGMARGIDKMTIEHGKAMLGDGKSMVEDMMGGKEMMEMHAKGMTPEKSPMMGASHQQGEA
ncbi:MAG: hypothetical protein ACLPX5_06140, partial [Dissulfurispiraceae bacterium]